MCVNFILASAQLATHNPSEIIDAAYLLKFYCEYRPLLGQARRAALLQRKL
jgi:hypothetical protein